MDLMINPYKRVIVKETIKIKDQAPMEDWSILSDHVIYVTHGKSDTFQKLSINSVDYRQIEIYIKAYIMINPSRLV